MRQIELSDPIYEIYAYFINKVTNACNNLECNNIIFLILMPGSHILNLYNGKINVMLIGPIFCL